MSSIILSTGSRYVLPLMLLFSVFLLLRGHNEPGGGFTGGLVAASGFALFAVAHGAQAARRALRFSPRMLMTWGLLIALASGTPALLVGGEFLTGLWLKLALPGIGEVKVGTPLVFDVGVYLTVVGITLMMVFAMMEEEA
jgi:multicomponent Na+:H+ antiporter subunit B